MNADEIAERRGPKFGRIEGVVVWAIPGVDPSDGLPDKIPDKALADMDDRISSVVKERRKNGPPESA